MRVLGKSRYTVCIDSNSCRESIFNHETTDTGPGGAGTFLMEHNPKSIRGVGGCFLKFSKSIMVLFLSQKKEGVPQNMIIKVHGTFHYQNVRICNQLTVNYQK